MKLIVFESGSWIEPWHEFSKASLSGEGLLWGCVVEASSTYDDCICGLLFEPEDLEAFRSLPSWLIPQNASIERRCSLLNAALMGSKQSSGANFQVKAWDIDPAGRAPEDGLPFWQSLCALVKEKTIVIVVDARIPM